jgi:hypothetical protein
MIRFRPITPQRWAGHYERIPGETTTFHVDTNDRISIYWDDPYSGDRLRSPARSSEDMLELGAAVNRVKLRYGSYRGMTMGSISRSMRLKVYVRVRSGTALMWGCHFILPIAV